MDRPDATTPPAPGASTPQPPRPPIPAWQPPALAPAAPEPARRKLSGVAVAVACVGAIGMMGFFAKAAVNGFLRARDAAAIESQDPYALMNREFMRHPERLQVSLVRGAQAGTRRNLPDAQLTFEDRAVVTNLGHAVRAIIAYRGEMPGPDGGTLSLDAEMRQYYHPKGAVVIETACFSGSGSCDVPRDLIDRTDATVLKHLSDDGVESLLPPEAECEASPMAMRNHVNRMTVCRFGPDVLMSVMRLSREQTMAEFRRLAADPETQAEAGQAAREAR